MATTNGRDTIIRLSKDSKHLEDNKILTEAYENCEHNKSNSFIHSIMNIEDDEGNSEQELMLMSYDRTNDYDYEKSKQCDWMCTNLNINNMNILDFIGSNEKLVIRPSVKIGSVPKEKFLLGGFLEFEIGLTLPL